MILFGTIDKHRFGDGIKPVCKEVFSIFFSRTREMDLTIQESEEKRKQLLSKSFFQ
jgi:hypothetical protein